MAHDHEELMELTHDPVPGYRTIFWVAITVGLLYLGFILVRTL